MRDLVCKLTADEIAQHAADAAEAGEKRTAADASVESHRAGAKIAKEESEGHSAVVAEHLRCVRSGQETRLVDCVEDYDEGADRMFTIRTETGEIIHSRNVKEHERQGVLRMLGREPTSEDQDREDRTPAGA